MTTVETNEVEWTGRRVECTGKSGIKKKEKEKGHNSRQQAKTQVLYFLKTFLINKHCPMAKHCVQTFLHGHTYTEEQHTLRRTQSYTPTYVRRAALIALIFQRMGAWISASAAPRSNTTRIHRMNWERGRKTCWLESCCPLTLFLLPTLTYPTSK